MIDFTSFGKLIPDSVQLHYSLSTASLQLPYSLNSYRSLYPQQLPIISSALYTHHIAVPVQLSEKLRQVEMKVQTVLIEIIWSAV